MKTLASLSDIDSVEDITAEAFDIGKVYEETIIYRTKSNAGRQGVFHPSAVGMCGRRNVYEYIRAPWNREPNAQSEEIFAMGHMVHSHVQTILHDVPKYLATKGLIAEFEDEVRTDRGSDELFNTLGIGGTCDGVLRVEKPGEFVQRAVVEIKSIRKKGFDEVCQERTPKLPHLMQAHIYAYRFDAPLIYIWYYNKDDSKKVVIPCLFNWDLFTKTVELYESWIKHVEAGTLPDREENFFMCPECPYVDICEPSIVPKIKDRKSQRTRDRFARRSLGVKS